MAYVTIVLIVIFNSDRDLCVSCAIIMADNYSHWNVTPRQSLDAGPSSIHEFDI